VIEITATTAPPPIPLIAGQVLIARGEELPLAAEAGGGLMGWLSPVGVPSPDQGSVLYNAWHEYAALDPSRTASEQGVNPGHAVGSPSLRLYDLATGVDRLVEEGAFSAAWRRDGVVACFKGQETDFRLGVPYVGHVLVRSRLEAAPTRWTGEVGRYVVVAWAGERLLVYRMLEGERLDVLVLEGPGRVQTVAQDAKIVAVSPQGDRILVAGSTLGRVLDLASGRELAALDLLVGGQPAGHPPLGRLEHSGSWVGDLVVTESDLGLVVLRVSASTLSVERVVPVPRDRFPWGVAEPQFLDPAGRYVLFRASTPAPGAGDAEPRVVHRYLTCDVRDLACAEGPLRTERNLFVVRNPSRPAG
jgi:hypothetical protein